ncbi:MAG: hypothetical protein ACRCWI_06245 [Brevinema sp.]
MTLVEFISSVCKEVLIEENFFTNSIKKENKKIYKNTPNKPSSLISEAILKQMIQQGTVHTLSENYRFTPLARDLFREYNNKKNKR